MATNDLDREYQRLHDEGTRLAGDLIELSQRATVYHHLYEASGGNHIFPLIAAHGALWAKGYFRWGMQLSRLLSLQYAGRRDVREQQLKALDEFADTFRDINRRVCVDTYANYHFTARYGDHPEVQSFVDADLLKALSLVHAARREDRTLSDVEKREVFVAHFLNEQQHIVGPTLERATAAFDWPLVKLIALRPRVRFAYFPDRKRLWFHNFTNRDERIRRGLQAFDTAASVGWSEVEAALARYDILPKAFFVDSARYFSGLRDTTLATA
ncbi:MAG: hypothetical protein KDA93_20100 [Planctomycetaceae bacterium]|nr:hypothetical protein [Planctomycetaceae bacterium]